MNLSRKQLMKYLLPAMLMMILNQAYTVVDNIIVARYVNEEALAVLSNVNTLLSLGYCLVGGIASTATVIIGQAYGRKDYIGIKKAFISILKIAFIIASIAAFSYKIFSYQLLGLVNTPAQIMEACIQLLNIYIFSIVLNVLAQSLASSINGMGISKEPTIIISFCQILNIILDLICVRGFHLGLMGAAYASIFAEIVSIIGLYLFFTSTLKQAHVQFETADIKDSSYIQQATSLALPSMLQQSVMTIGTIMISTLINSYGVAYISGFSASSSICNLFLIPLISITNCAEVFAAQAIGAQDKQSYHFVENYLKRTGIILSMLISFVLFLLAKPLVSLFLTEEAGASLIFATKLTILYLPNMLIIFIKYLNDAICKANLKINYFVMTSFAALFFRVCLSYLLVPQFGLLYINVATLIGNFIGMLLSISLRQNMLKENFEEKKELLA